MDKNKQRNGLPPNYVHSLDSSHMLMSAGQCYKAGLTFAAVHDSYWTHAGSVETMNRTLREQFVQLHSPALLEELAKSFRDRYPDVDWDQEDLRPPPRGELDLDLVKESTYFFA